MLPRFRAGAFAVFALTFVVSMLLGDRGATADALTLEPALVLDGREWWTPLTTAFRYPEGLGLLALLWTLAIQWVIGSRLEGFWGTTRYLVMIIVAAVVGYASTLGLAIVMPAAAELSYAGAGPIDVAAAVAFAIVFKREKLTLGSTHISPALVGGIAAALALVFPLLVALVGKIPAAQAWPTLIPGVVAGVVATVFVQPWRKRENSGKVGRSEQRAHLRVVRTPDDMLN
ncbi:MAG TPA: rhomboid family intramembrane serine protease [Enhygromyxa sp.]|nr:rhomboid family intramembrane serine protease [Enhygromyxa sp.]